MTIVNDKHASMEKPIYVTQPSLPPLEEFIDSLKEIWDSKYLTNNGPFHKQLEKELASYLNVPYVSLFANGTLALVTALQVMRISGEVITTPYTFAATTHALNWNGITPVFVDIETDYCNIDYKKIEAAITPNTAAILPVHVYGNPANVEQIGAIADTYGLKVIYDAAHAFGVNYKGQSILNYGDLSILSFHATKVYNTIEGGAIISHDEKTKKRIDHLKNFGFAGETTIIAAGINGKMNEIQAALGLLNLKHIRENIHKRRRVAQHYNNDLKNVKGLTILQQNKDADNNYPYYPIFIDESKFGASRDELYNKMKSHGIYGRRYFYPLASEFPIYRGLSSSIPDNLPNSHCIANSVICLPIYPDINVGTIEKIINVVKGY